MRSNSRLICTSVGDEFPPPRWIVLVFIHFIFHFRLNLCLYGHTTKLCSIGLPSHHDRQLHSTNMHSENERDPPWESVPSLSGVSTTRMSHSTTSNISSFAQLACRTCTVVGFIARFCSLGNERDSFWESVPSPILSNCSRLRPRKTTFTGESFAQLACRVYIIVGFIARFL